ncbi:MAG: metallophosphoesterase [Enhygromyxa sp.]
MGGRIAGLFGALLLTGACERMTPPPAHERESAKASAAETKTEPSKKAEAEASPARKAAGPSPGELPASGDRFPAPARLVAIGDLHGDLAAARRALRLAGAIDEDDRWIGGELVVVQTGDQLDRGDDEQAILELLAKIQREAAEAGGALHILNGNHEFMNALGDLRYVTTGGLADFADAPGVDPDTPELAPLMAKVPEPARPRVAAFWPGQPWARELAKRNVAVVVGDSVFVHGGLTPAWAGQIRSINEQARAWLSGERSEPPAAIVDPDGPVWSRHYSDNPGEQECEMLGEALATIGVARMVVGHTVHTEGIRSACEERVWMVDVGMAAYYGGPVEVLEIRGEQVSVLR